ncbi:MAG: hypothetical protein J6R88_05940 [Clostridia bacterium]|nr:hypothetical protein [Clostridia bacterium]
MEILKIVVIAVVGLIIYVYLKSLNSELSALTLIATGVILLIFIVDYLTKAISLFSELSYGLNINVNVFKIVLKIIIISYVVEFTESLCVDLGATGIGAKVSLSGKLIILVTASPIFYTLITTLTQFLK